MPARRRGPHADTRATGLAADAPAPRVVTGSQRVGQALNGVHPAAASGRPDRLGAVVASGGGGLGRDGGAGGLTGGQAGDQGGELHVVGLATDHADVGGHSGMFPCFLAGREALLVRSVRSARTTWERVVDGAMTASTYPRSAASYGLTSASS